MDHLTRFRQANPHASGHVPLFTVHINTTADSTMVVDQSAAMMGDIRTVAGIKTLIGVHALGHDASSGNYAPLPDYISSFMLTRVLQGNSFIIDLELIKHRQLQLKFFKDKGAFVTAELVQDGQDKPISAILTHIQVLVRGSIQDPGLVHMKIFAFDPKSKKEVCETFVM
jgi:hypothetical protein